MHREQATVLRLYLACYDRADQATQREAVTALATTVITRLAPDQLLSCYQQLFEQWISSLSTDELVAWQQSDDRQSLTL